MQLDDILPNSDRRALFRRMQLTDDGLMLGAETALAKMGRDESLCSKEANITSVAMATN